MYTFTFVPAPEPMPTVINWYKLQVGTQTVYIKEPNEISPDSEARVSFGNSSYAMVYRYQNGEWRENNIVAGIPGLGSGISIASLESG